jgi:3-hydroxyisobutyrate dehydrogenase-like beta-hydroxyacid dehydrogenase
MTTPAATIGLLHPGAMGSSIGAAATGNARVLWASEGRSGATAERAQRAGLQDAGSVEALVAASDAIMSVCPPHAAEDVARRVAGLGFSGTYLDANAVSPATARSVAAIVGEAGARFVDGGIVGGPAWKPGTTRLYLAGEAAAEAARWFEGSPLDVVVIEGGAGAASTLKMTYAAYTKGSTALVASILAVARREGVETALRAEWGISQPRLVAGLDRQLQGAAPKAWRWVGEMEEISATFEAAGLPGGFHAAAADLYGRLDRYRDADPPPSVDEIVDAALGD